MTAYVEGVHLVGVEDDRAGVSALADRLGGAVGLAGLLADLNRSGRRVPAPGLAVRRAFTWDAEDRRTARWWPQGITSSADAGDAAAAVAGSGSRRLLLVSWYAHDLGDGVVQGSRITVVDRDTLDYRHVLLVAPDVGDDGSLLLHPVRVHAGGIVWRGDRLHVAATARGIVTCRLDDLVRVPDALASGDPRHLRAAADGGKVSSYGYRYLLPVGSGYEARTDDGHDRLRYSFLSLDRSTPEPGLLAGEYGSSRQTRRLVRFGLTADGALDTGEDGVARPLLLDLEGPGRMQGAVWAGGDYHLTVSHGPWAPGSLYAGQPGAFRHRRWATPMGPEDLTWWPDDDLLWSVTEHPHRRWVLGLSRG